MNEQLLLPARIHSEVIHHYRVIYADPPWSFLVWGQPNKKGRMIHGNPFARLASGHYATVETDQLCALPVQELAADDCALFMWATWPNLPDAIRLGRAWGFEYKTLGFDWVKRTANGKGWHIGMGYWTRANSEPCLLFTRGTSKRKSKGVRQVIANMDQTELFPPIIEPLTIHSAKPFEAYRRIEALLDGPYLELFARVAWPGWDVWGAEAPNSIDWQRDFMRQGTRQVAASVPEAQLALWGAG